MPRNSRCTPLNLSPCPTLNPPESDLTYTLTIPLIWEIPTLSPTLSQVPLPTALFVIPPIASRISLLPYCPVTLSTAGSFSRSWWVIQHGPKPHMEGFPSATPLSLPRPPPSSTHRRVIIQRTNWAGLLAESDTSLAMGGAILRRCLFSCVYRPASRPTGRVLIIMPAQIWPEHRGL